MSHTEMSLERCYVGRIEYFDYRIVALCAEAAGTYMRMPATSWRMRDTQRVLDSCLNGRLYANKKSLAAVWNNYDCSNWEICTQVDLSAMVFRDSC